MKYYLMMVGSPLIGASEHLPVENARNRLRRAMFAEVSRTAFKLFLEKGFEETTAEDISEAAGISRSTYFRYFATKEDVVVGTLVRFGDLMLASLRSCPDDDGIWSALRVALEPMIAAQEQQEPISGLDVARLIHRNPSLRSRHFEKTMSWQAALVPEVARRLGVADDPIDPRPSALVAAALGSLSAATDAWVASDGQRSLSRLVDSAMGSLG